MSEGKYLCAHGRMKGSCPNTRCPWRLVPQTLTSMTGIQDAVPDPSFDLSMRRDINLSSAPTKPWHLAMVGIVRQAMRNRMIEKIFQMLKDLKPTSVSMVEWANRIPQLSEWLERAFYNAADSFDEYQDSSTISTRLNRHVFNQSMIVADVSSGSSSIINSTHAEVQRPSTTAPVTAPWSTQPFAAPSSTQQLEELEGFEAVEDEEQTFHQYHSTISLAGWRPHPDTLVESSSLASVKLPPLSYKVKLPHSVYSTGKLSAPQMEAVSYACQRHESFLSGGERRGFFLGDGAGVGKGRQVSGIIYENWLCARRRHVWFSASTDLIVDARRDLEDIGADIECFEMKGLPYSKILFGDGIFFVTYAGIVGSSGRKTRLKQLLAWMGNEGFDGCLIFDECHKAKNLQLDDSKTGGTKSARAVFSIQSSCPKARVVYCSATGISDPRDMGYMTRLGLWGPGSAFPSGFSSFQKAVEKGGVGMMEIVAMDMKQSGSYFSRTLSFDGCSYAVVEDPLTPEDLEVWSNSAKFWQILYVDLNRGLEDGTLDFHTGESYIDDDDLDGDDLDFWDEILSDDDDDERPLQVRAKNARTSVMRYFWGSHQRFFRDLCMSFKVPQTVRMAQEALSEGKSVVIGLQSTGGAATERQQERQGGGATAVDIISTPQHTLTRVIKKLFPLPKKPPSVLEKEETKRSERIREHMNYSGTPDNEYALSDTSSGTNSDTCDKWKSFDKEGNRIKTDQMSRLERLAQPSHQTSSLTTKVASSISGLHKNVDDNVERELQESEASCGRTTRTIYEVDDDDDEPVQVKSVVTSVEKKIKSDSSKNDDLLQWILREHRQDAHFPFKCLLDYLFEHGWNKWPVTKKISDIPKYDTAYFPSWTQKNRGIYVSVSGDFLEGRDYFYTNEDVVEYLQRFGNNYDSAGISSKFDILGRRSRYPDQHAVKISYQSVFKEMEAPSLKKAKRENTRTNRLNYFEDEDEVEDDNDDEDDDDDEDEDDDDDDDEDDDDDDDDDEEEEEYKEENDDDEDADDDDACFVCDNGGKVLLCDSCPLVFHLNCLIPSLKEIPSGDWFCPVCISNGRASGDIAMALISVQAMKNKMKEGKNGPSTKAKLLPKGYVYEQASSSTRPAISKYMSKQKIDPKPSAIKKRKIIIDSEDSESGDDSDESYFDSDHEVQGVDDPAAAAELENNYAQAFSARQAYLDRIDMLNLPVNALDSLIDKLGGSENVAELTGRKFRLVRIPGSDKFVFEKRNVNGVSMDYQNIFEKGLFLAGNKRVAIISEAASSGISLQADRRVANQQRRVHITLELPWSAERAIQQLGRTHRSNQSSSPEYKLLISSLGGEKRFASSVARRIEKLGALTQGDRKATAGAQSMNIISFNFESKYGVKSLETLLNKVWSTRNSSGFSNEYLSDEHARELREELEKSPSLRIYLEGDDISSSIPVSVAYKFWLQKVGIDSPQIIKKNFLVDKFLNRLLGLEPEKQNMIFKEFTNTYDDLILRARKDGSYDEGVLEISGSSLHAIKGEVHIAVPIRKGDDSGPCFYHKVFVDKGTTWLQSQEILDKAIKEASESRSLAKKGRKSQKSFCGYFRSQRRSNVIMMAVETEVPEFVSYGEKVVVYRPRFGKVHISRSTLDLYDKVDDEGEAKKIWEEDYNRNVSWGRVKTYHIITGAVVSLWPTIHETMRKFALKNHSTFSLRVIRARVLGEEPFPESRGKHSDGNDDDVVIVGSQEDKTTNIRQEQVSKEHKIIGLNIDDRFITEVLRAIDTNVALVVSQELRTPELAPSVPLAAQSIFQPHFDLAIAAQHPTQEQSNIFGVQRNCSDVSSPLVEHISALNNIVDLTFD